MENELTLILEKDIQELTPKLIAFNNKELLQAVNNKLSIYEGITYSDEQIADAKKDRASLNSFNKALNSERLRIQKIYQEPITLFKSQVDEVIARVNEVGSKIDAQIKTYEEQKKNNKKEEIVKYFNETFKDLKEYVPLSKIFNEKWLNASYSMSQIQLDIGNLLDKITNDLITIYNLENTDNETIRAFYFRTLDLGLALQENQRLQEEKRKQAQLKQEQENKQQENNKKEEITPTQQQEDVNKKEQTYEMHFGVVATREQLIELKEFFTTNKIKYFKI